MGLQFLKITSIQHLHASYLAGPNVNFDNCIRIGRNIRVDIGDF